MRESLIIPFRIKDGHCQISHAEERKNSKGSGSDTGKLVKGTKDKDIVSFENMYMAAKK